MATYTVNLTGSMTSSYAYATLNGTKTTTTGTTTYTSKPTIAVYVDGGVSGRSNCKVTLNGTTVKSGYGSYIVDIGDADTVNIKFTVAGENYSTYYTCDITTETSTPPDPMAPHDGHNTNIGQVARQIEAGTVRFGGVGREIGSGLTLVNGVAREIPFAAPVQVVISGAPYSGRAYATINGSAVYNVGTYEYDEMPTISVYVAGANTSMSQKCKVTLDGQTVLSGKGTYNLNVDANKITIEFTNKGSISMWVYICDITTE